MARLRIRYLALINIILLVITALSEATLHLGQPGTRPTAKSTDHRSSSTQLLKPDHAAKRSVSIPSEITKHTRRVGSKGLQPLKRPALSSTSTSLSELSVSHRNPSRSLLSPKTPSPLNVTLKTFTAILDPTLQSISDHITFFTKVISAATSYYTSLTPVQDFEITYQHFKLRLTTKKGDTIDWIIVKRIGQVVLEYARAGFYGWYYFICYIGPVAVAVMLGFRPRDLNGIVQWIG